MQWYDPIIEIWTESGGGELLKRDCPIKRHLKVLIVVDGDEEEKGTHICPIMCVKLFSGRNLITNKKEGRMHDFGFLRVGGRFSPLGWLPPFSSLILFIC